MLKITLRFILFRDKEKLRKLHIHFLISKMNHIFLLQSPSTPTYSCRSQSYLFFYLEHEVICANYPREISRKLFSRAKFFIATCYLDINILQPK